MLIVDAANVVGSRPDGWWRDRPGAAARLIARVGEAVAAGRLSGPACPVTVVLEGRARDADPPPLEGVSVLRAPGSGDDTIVALASESSAASASVASASGDVDREVIVVTADRALAGRVRAAGAGVWPPGRLLDILH